MGYYSPDTFSQPEAFGLTLVDTIERYEDLSYAFDLVAIWWHEDGSIYFAADQGCSCPSPFEDFDSLEKLTKVSGWADLAAQLLELSPDYGSDENKARYSAEVAEAVLKVRELARG